MIKKKKGKKKKEGKKKKVVKYSEGRGKRSSRSLGFEPTESHRWVKKWPGCWHKRLGSRATPCASGWPISKIPRWKIYRIYFDRNHQGREREREIPTIVYLFDDCHYRERTPPKIIYGWPEVDMEYASCLNLDDLWSSFFLSVEYKLCDPTYTKR